MKLPAHGQLGTTLPHSRTQINGLVLVSEVLLQFPILTSQNFIAVGVRWGLPKLRDQSTGRMKHTGAITTVQYAKRMFCPTVVLPGWLSPVTIFANVFFKAENFNARSRG